MKLGPFFISYRKWIISLGVFVFLKLIIAFLAFILNLSFFQLFSLESDALSDVSINDVHYRLKSRVDLDNRLQSDSTILLINSGDLDHRYFRAYLSELLMLINHFDPICIGVDHDFSSENKLGTEALVNTVNSIPNIVLAQTGYDHKLKIGGIYGDAHFPNNQESVRFYYSKKTTFAYQLARLAADSLVPIQGEAFIINYQSFDNGVSHVNNTSDQFYNSNFKYINAQEVFSLKTDTNELKGLLNGKIIIVGHLGSICTDASGGVKFDNSIFDVEDKHKVPCDLANLYNREKKMFGAVIHANAIVNILDSDKRFTNLNGILSNALFNMMLLLFIFYAIFKSKGKVSNILIMIILSIPLLYLVLMLMNSNIYISAGISLLEFLFVEEFIEILMPLMLKNKFIRNELDR